jgi:hypothetical protein
MNAHEPRLSKSQHDMLATAALSPDGTVLAIGWNRHAPTSHMKSFATNTAQALEWRGLLVEVPARGWGRIYRITDKGRALIGGQP